MEQCNITADEINITNNTKLLFFNSCISANTITCTNGTLYLSTGVLNCDIVNANSGANGRIPIEIYMAHVNITSFNVVAQCSLSEVVVLMTALTVNAAVRVSITGCASITFIQINDASGKVWLDGVGTYYEVSGSTSRLTKNGYWYCTGT